MSPLVSERPKMVHPKPFLTPHLKTPRDIATKGEGALSGHSSTIDVTIAEISVPADKKQTYSR